MFLGEHGIVGNGHMMMLEDNSAAVADLILTAYEDLTDVEDGTGYEEDPRSVVPWSRRPPARCGGTRRCSPICC